MATSAHISRISVASELGLGSTKSQLVSRIEDLDLKYLDVITDRHVTYMYGRPFTETLYLQLSLADNTPGFECYTL